METFRIILAFLTTFVFLINGQEDVRRSRHHRVLQDETVWTTWSHWTPCSFTCNQGVRSRYRGCVMRTSGGLERKDDAKCPGKAHEYQICQDQVCPLGYGTPLEYQCAQKNEQVFMGKTYEWVPINAGVNECELTCMASGYAFYNSFGHATDGTPCHMRQHRDSDDGNEEYSVCVNGTCKMVGCDDLVDSGTRLDKCRVCGGENSKCYHYRNSYMILDPPREGHQQYQDVIRVPQGATYVEVTDHSNNYLALVDADTGTYILNGNWMIDWPSRYEAEETVIVYERRGMAEILTIRGPTTMNLTLKLVFSERNPGVHYEFYIPIDKRDQIELFQPKTDFEEPDYIPPPFRKPIYGQNAELYETNNKNILSSIINATTAEPRTTQRYHRGIEIPLRRALDADGKMVDLDPVTESPTTTEGVTEESHAEDEQPIDDGIPWYLRAHKSEEYDELIKGGIPLQPAHTPLLPGLNQPVYQWPTSNNNFNYALYGPHSVQSPYGPNTLSQRNPSQETPDQTSNQYHENPNYSANSHNQNVYNPRYGSDINLGKIKALFSGQTNEKENFYDNVDQKALLDEAYSSFRSNIGGLEDYLKSPVAKETKENGLASGASVPFDNQGGSVILNPYARPYPYARNPLETQLNNQLTGLTNPVQLHLESQTHTTDQPSQEGAYHQTTLITSSPIKNTVQLYVETIRNVPKQSSEYTPESLPSIQHTPGAEEYPVANHRHDVNSQGSAFNNWNARETFHKETVLERPNQSFIHQSIKKTASNSYAVPATRAPVLATRAPVLTTRAPVVPNAHEIVRTYDRTYRHNNAAPSRSYSSPLGLETPDSFHNSYPSDRGPYHQHGADSWLTTTTTTLLPTYAAGSRGLVIRGRSSYLDYYRDQRRHQAQRDIQRDYNTDSYKETVYGNLYNFQRQPTAVSEDRGTFGHTTSIDETYADSAVEQQRHYRNSYGRELAELRSDDNQDIPLITQVSEDDKSYNRFIPMNVESRNALIINRQQEQKQFPTNHIVDDKHNPIENTKNSIVDHPKAFNTENNFKYLPDFSEEIEKIVEKTQTGEKIVLYDLSDLFDDDDKENRDFVHANNLHGIDEDADSNDIFNKIETPIISEEMEDNKPVIVDDVYESINRVSVLPATRRPDPPHTTELHQAPTEMPPRLISDAAASISPSATSGVIFLIDRRAESFQTCGKCKPSRKLMHSFCNSDLVARITVLDIATSSNETIYNVAYGEIYRQIGELQQTDRIRVTNSCNCPHLRKKNEYLVTGELVEGSLTLTSNSYTKKFNSKSKTKVDKLKRRCLGSR